MEKWLLVGMIAVGLLLGITLSSSLPGSQTKSVDLESPVLLGVEAKAQEQDNGVNFLQKEAGIAAYAKGEEALDLSQVESAFKSVETASDSYIIGEVALPDLPEKVHPHVYVNQDGWVVAYYSKAEPASKVMQWVGYEGGKVQTTTLEDAIQAIFDSLQRPYPEPGGIGYYNFQYPNANRILLVTERIGSDGYDAEKKDTFHLTVPNNARLYEASWALRQYGNERGHFYIDDTMLGNIEWQNGIAYGDLTSNIKKDFRHQLTTKQNCDDNCSSSTSVITLIYQVAGE